MPFHPISDGHEWINFRHSNLGTLPSWNTDKLHVHVHVQAFIAQWPITMCVWILSNCRDVHCDLPQVTNSW